MKCVKAAKKLILLLIAVFITALVAGFCLINGGFAFADTSDYNESYRNRLAFSPERGWNNDPNGLLYVNGTYHAYYQYNADKNSNVWGNMSWGHATSKDLVTWTEQEELAIPIGLQGYQAMFSGSAVYDEYNTSGLFDTDLATGKVAENQGIVAILTQPLWDEEKGCDAQRQILAYSKTDGTSFEIYGEILAGIDAGNGYYEDFRDPKVFWNETLGKWLMVVGGGSVRMYSSDNLIDWEFIGETGYWGECPDISRFEVNGKEKYVLIISPEDRNVSHQYNGTDRTDTFYPAEYYVVGDLNEKGLFVSYDTPKRLSEGIDSYAWQSFNNSPDGKVYGLSWSQSWLTDTQYIDFRKTHNGGLTVACELQLEEAGGDYILKRTPVEAFETLRGETPVKEYNGKLEAGKNALADVRADIADITLELDFTASNATYAELDLRVSANERIVIKYDLESNTLSLDRSQSSLIAKDKKLYKDIYKKQTELVGGKLTLRILLDRAFISVFANGGEASFFSAVFPSAISDGMRLVSDGDINVNAQIYSMKSIFGNETSVDELILTPEKIDENTYKIDTTVGSSVPVIASSFAQGFDYSAVNFTVSDGADCIKITRAGGTAYINAVKEGSAKITVTYGSTAKTVDVYIYQNGFESQVGFDNRYRGYSYVRNDGLFFSSGGEDAFTFGNVSGENFVYSAEFTPVKEGSQAGGLVFGYNGNVSGVWFVTADLKEGCLKLVQFRGEKEGGDLLSQASYGFTANEGYKLTAVMNGGLLKVYVNDDINASLIYNISKYRGGRVGLNVYNADMAINNVTFSNIIASDNFFDFGENKVLKVVNVTDGSYRLRDGDYTFERGNLSLNSAYLSTLEDDTEYVFRVITPSFDFNVTVKTDFAPSSLVLMKEEYTRDSDLTLAVSAGVEVYKLEINGEERDFTREGDIITVSSQALKNLLSGSHTVKVYTSKGRPQTVFTLSTVNDFRDEDTVAVTHTFLYVDIAIFATLIVGYAVISLVLKRRKK